MQTFKHLRCYFVFIPSFTEDSYLWSCSALCRCISGFFFFFYSREIKKQGMIQWIYIVLFVSYWKVLSGNFEQRLPFLLQTYYKCIINMIMYSGSLPCKIEHFTHMLVWWCCCGYCFWTCDSMEAKKQAVLYRWLVSVLILCCGFLEGDTFRLCSHTPCG